MLAVVCGRPRGVSAQRVGAPVPWLEMLDRASEDRQHRKVRRALADGQLWLPPESGEHQSDLVSGLVQLAVHDNHLVAGDRLFHCPSAIWAGSAAFNNPALMVC